MVQSIYLICLYLPRLLTGKVVVKLFGRNDEKAAHAIYQEISITYALSQMKNFVKLAAFCEYPFALVLKYYPLGSLASMIKSTPQAFNKRRVVSFSHDIATALSVMHDRGFVHSDLKPDNVLIDADSNGMFCVLTDFGITQVVTQQSLGVQAFKVSNIRGASYAYSAPEILRGLTEGSSFHATSAVRFQTDIYSLAVSMLQILCKIKPWSNMY